MHVAGSRSALCNKDAGSITLQPLYYIVALRSNDWLGHSSISSAGSPVVKGIIINLICGCVCVVGD